MILGNPPYNGYAGMAVEEERELSTAYRSTKRVRRPEGQGLNDLYVRFFRMAERRISQKTGRGVVCFHLQLLVARRAVVHRHEGALSWRHSTLSALTVSTATSTRPARRHLTATRDPSIFSTPEAPVGIQVGTAITTLVRKVDHEATVPKIGFRNLWGRPSGSSSRI